MKPINTRSLNIRSFLFLCCGCLLAFASAPLPPQPPDTLYQEGLRYYRSRDYLNAIKFLFAYKQVKQDALSPEFIHQIDDALKYAESQVKLAIQTKNELDRHGEVTKIVVRGKADGTDMTVPFRQPRLKNQQQPVLPTNPLTNFNK